MNIAALYPPRPRPAPAPTPADCWATWDAGTIAMCTKCPQDVVERNWPAIHAAFVERGIASPEILAGALGTIAVETAHTFAPVQEAFWLDDAWRYANLRYAPYWGRGYVQLTWDYNYESYGAELGVDLLNNPDLAMEAGVAAEVMAEYFARSGAAEFASTCDWTGCRKKVQGADAGLEELIEVTTCLGYP